MKQLTDNATGLSRLYGLDAAAPESQRIWQKGEYSMRKSNKLTAHHDRPFVQSTQPSTQQIADFHHAWAEEYCIRNTLRCVYAALLDSPRPYMAVEGKLGMLDHIGEFVSAQSPMMARAHQDALQFLQHLMNLP